MYFTSYKDKRLFYQIVFSDNHGLDKLFIIFLSYSFIYFGGQPLLTRGSAGVMEFESQSAP